jgi:hypothetical protein
MTHFPSRKKPRKREINGMSEKVIMIHSYAIVIIVKKEWSRFQFLLIWKASI